MSESQTGENDGSYRDRFANKEAAEQADEQREQQEEETRKEVSEDLGLKQQLQQDRKNHIFHVEMYGRDLPFNALPDEATDALESKRARMMHCAQRGQWEEFAEQADILTTNAAEWLAQAWDGDGTMNNAQDWVEVYDPDELLELLNKVDNKGQGAEMEQIVGFLDAGSDSGGSNS